MRILNLEVCEDKKLLIYAARVYTPPSVFGCVDFLWECTRNFIQ